MSKKLSIYNSENLVIILLN